MKDGTYIVRMRNGMPTLSDPIAMSDGYWVSSEGVSVHGKLDVHGIQDALSLMSIHDGTVVGVWENEGISYIDKSIHISEKSSALAVAEVFNQLAIYDCKEGKAIHL